MNLPEPVAWLIRVGDAPHWSYCETESDADFYGKQSGMRYEKKPLFTEAQLREALASHEAVMRQALNLLGPTAPECCGCEYEWNEAIKALEAALK